MAAVNLYHDIYKTKYEVSKYPLPMTNIITEVRLKI